MDHSFPTPPENSRDETTGDESERLIALPFQLIQRDSGIIIRRGRAQVMIGGDRAWETIQTLVDTMRGEGATAAEVCRLFAAPDRPPVAQLIKQLAARNFLVPPHSDLVPSGRDTALDVFYWHIGLSTAEVNRKLNQVRLAIAGVNHISNQLARSLMAAGNTNLEVIDHPLLRNLSFFEDSSKIRPSCWIAPTEPVAHHDWQERLSAGSFDCLVATSDFGGLRLMEPWNALCLKLNRHFLPVVLQDLIGTIGPLVIPGETACFECYRARLASNRRGEDLDLPSGAAAFENQHLAGFHPSMPSILGDIAALELTKFYSRALPFWKAGSVIEVNLLAGRMDSRKVLRVPRCRACSTLIRRSSPSITRTPLGTKGIEE